jgi:hypothetical protein
MKENDWLQRGVAILRGLRCEAFFFLGVYLIDINNSMAYVANFNEIFLVEGKPILFSELRLGDNY